MSEKADDSRGKGCSYNLIAFPPSLEVKEEVELRREQQSSYTVV
jgi:hypothetical protein